MAVSDDPEIRRSRAQFAKEQGEHWRQIHADELAQLPAGTTVIIEVVTGEFVTGTSWLETREAYEQKFGKGRTISGSYEVARPIFVGGGVWLS